MVPKILAPFLPLFLLLTAPLCLPGCDQPISKSLRFLRRVAAVHEIINIKMPSTLESTGIGQPLAELEGIGEIPSRDIAGLQPVPTRGGYDPTAPGPRRIRGRVDFSVKELPRDVAMTLRKRGAAFRACYRYQLNQIPDLEGSLEIFFLVTAQGRVDGVRVMERTVENEKMEACFLRQLSRLRFSKQERSAHYQIRFEFRIEDSPHP